MRTILIGDVHGHLDALKTLLWSVGLNRETDQLVLLGNLMDYGPDSCGVYLFVRELQEDMKRRLICIRGNHEQMFMDSELLTRGQMANRFLWKDSGGKETLRSFKDYRHSTGKAGAWLRDNTRPWFEDLDFIAVHGDIRDEIVWNNSQDTFIWGSDGVTYNDYSGKLTVVGHTQVDTPTYLDGSRGESRFHPKYGTWFELPKRGMIAIHTGCGFGGNLTAMIIENGWMRFEYVKSIAD